MTTVAVTGAASRIGSGLCALLEADERVDRIVGVDVVEPSMPVAKLDFRLADVRDPVLPRVLEDVDVVVHLATWMVGPVSEDLHLAYVVQGTRNVLAAAAKVGCSAVAHLSSAMVYGARDTGELPLAEDADRHVDPASVRPYHQLLAEELVTTFAAQHPDVRVAVLRPVTVLGEGLDSPVARFLEAPRVPMVAGCRPAVQVLDVDDLAKALHLAVLGDLRGPYNVAADGWLTTDEAASLLGRRPLRIPEAPLGAALSAARRTGVTDLSPAMMAYLMYPWVVDTGRLRAAGWRPARSHREVLRAFAVEHGPWVRVGRLRLRRRALYANAATAGALAGLAVWKAARRPSREGR
jgi:UDP-glucose 4-epimerase